MKKTLITLQFSIHPMTNNFIEIIKGALQRINTSNVTMSTDDVASTMIGEQEAVFDAVKAMVIHASKSGNSYSIQWYVFLGMSVGVHEFPRTLLNKNSVLIKKHMVHFNNMFPLSSIYILWVNPIIWIL